VDTQKKTRILVADDHAIVREGYCKVLEQEADFEVVAEAADGEEAISLTKELEPDIVLLDIRMPNINGIEATKQIKEACPNVTVIILSAYDDDQFVFSALEVGAAAYLLKSSRGREIVASIRAVCRGESVLHPSITRKVIERSISAANKPVQKERVGRLSEREKEVLTLATKGLSNKDIAKELSITIRTVQAHFTSVFNKLSVNSRSEALLLGLKEGWLSLANENPRDD
jgi:DNA-binding NarL/FixJ family response regulator